MHVLFRVLYEPAGQSAERKEKNENTQHQWHCSMYIENTSWKVPCTEFTHSALTRSISDTKTTSA